VSDHGHFLFGNLVSRQPPPIRDLYSGEAPEWTVEATGRPSHYLSIEARVDQARVVPLDLYHIYSTDSDLLVVADLPGLRASEVFFAVDLGLVTICSEAKPGQDDLGGGGLWRLCRDMRRGRYSQTLALPEDLSIDRWTATFEDSVLRIRIPRAA
jgi:HSP20 family molecular chaperone IbpA